MFETKLKKFVEKKIDSKTIQSDLKSILYDILQGVKDEKIKEDIHTVLNHIETFQLLSKITESFYTFLPIFWDSLNGGNIAIKKNEEKDHYLCKITLDFQDLGFIDTAVFLYKKDLKVDFFIENSKLKNQIKKNIEFLKSDLSNEGFLNIFINFLSKKDDNDLEKLLKFKSIVDIKV